MLADMLHPEPAPTTDIQKDWFASLGTRPVTDRGKRVVRKELRTLTTEEWQSFVDAVWSAAETYPDDNDTTSEYQLMVTNHLQVTAPAAHYGAAFLTWHREFLFR